MKKFWRILIGVGMVVFGIIGLMSSLMIEGEPTNEPVLTNTHPNVPAVDIDAAKQEEMRKETEAKKEANKTTTTPLDSTATQTPAVEFTEEEIKADRTLFKELVKDRSVEGCENLLDLRLQTLCRDNIRLALALRDNSLNTCELISVPEEKANCRDQVLLATAKQDDDYSVCIEIMNSTLRIRCQEEEARHKITEVTSINDCEKITSRKERNMCFDFFAAKRAVSQLEKEGADACGAISSPETRATCLLENAVRLAGSEKNVNPCRELEDQELQTACIRKVREELEINQTEASINTGDVTGCEGMTEDEGRQYCIDNALMSKAIEEHDPQFCTDIVDDSRRQRCLTDATREESMYFFKMAREEKDTKWCRLISDLLAQESCMTIVSQMTDSGT